MREKKMNTRGDILLSPTRIRKKLYHYVIDQAKKRSLSITTIVNECIEIHREHSENKNLP